MGFTTIRFITQTFGYSIGQTCGVPERVAWHHLGYVVRQGILKTEILNILGIYYITRGQDAQNDLNRRYSYHLPYSRYQVLVKNKSPLPHTSHQIVDSLDSTAPRLCFHQPIQMPLHANGCIHWIQAQKQVWGVQKA